VIAGLVVASAIAAGAPAALAQDTRPSATRFDREITIDWSSEAEVADSLFGGYNVWRSNDSDPESFILVRRFQRRYPVTWTYTGMATENPRRDFHDPDSVVALIKIEVSTQGDSAMTRDYVGVNPFNGFPYYYAVTWFSECLSDRNDTLWIEKPQPEPFPFMRGGEERWGVEVAGDTLEVTRVPCRRIDPVTNAPADTTRVFVYQGTVESQGPLREYAIESTRLESPVFPTSAPRDDLRDVVAIPNPYVLNAPWDVPGQRKIQFVNLTERATIRIFTLGGGLVRVLEHPVPGSSPEQGSIDWDLLNAHGRLVEPGIYMYVVETPGGVTDLVSKLVIVR
jgi:hypothetical protein